MRTNNGTGPAIRPILRLYLAGDAPAARRALECRKRIIAAAAEPLDIEIIDILEMPADAETAGILATPTLSDETVTPPRRLIGDISNTSQVLDYFGYRKKDATT